MPAIKDLTHLNEILAVLNRRPAGPKNRRSYFSTFEQILSGLSIASLVGSIIIVLLAKISWMPRASAMAWSFGLLGFGEIGEAREWG